MWRTFYQSKTYYKSLKTKQHEEKYKESGEIPNGTPSLYNENAVQLIIKELKILKLNLNKIKIVVSDSDTTTEIEELSVFYIKDIVLNINSFLEYKNSL